MQARTGDREEGRFPIREALPLMRLALAIELEHSSFVLIYELSRHHYAGTW